MHSSHTITTRPAGTLYSGTQDLLDLEAYTSLGTESEMSFHGGVTPLLHSKWERALRAHPDRAFANYICTGLRQGFRIGFSHTKPLRRATRNMLSATHPELIAEYLAKELQLNQMLGPFVDDIKSVHGSRFGVIPKEHGTGKGTNYQPRVAA